MVRNRGVGLPTSAGSGESEPLLHDSQHDEQSGASSITNVSDMSNGSSFLGIFLRSLSPSSPNSNSSTSRALQVTSSTVSWKWAKLLRSTWLSLATAVGMSSELAEFIANALPVSLSMALGFLPEILYMLLILMEFQKQVIYAVTRLILLVTFTPVTNGLCSAVLTLSSQAAAKGDLQDESDGCPSHHSPQYRFEPVQPTTDGDLIAIDEGFPGGITSDAAYSESTASTAAAATTTIAVTPATTLVQNDPSIAGLWASRAICLFVLSSVPLTAFIVLVHLPIARFIAGNQVSDTFLHDVSLLLIFAVPHTILQGVMQIRQTFYNSIGYPSLLILANFAGIAVMYGSVVIFQQWSPWWWNTVTPLRIPICGIVHAVTVIVTMCLLAKCVIKEVQRYLVRSGSSRSVQIGYLASFCKIMSLAAPSALSHLMDFGFRIDLLYLSGIFNVNGSILGEAFRMPLLARAFSRFVSVPSMTTMSRLVGGFFSTDNIQQAERAGAMAISSSVVLTLLAYKLAASQGIYFDNGELDNYDASFSLLIGMTIAACVVSFMSESVLVGIGKQRVVLLANMCGFVAFALLWYMCAMFQNGQFSAASAWSVVALSAAITTISQLNWLWGSQWQSN